MNIIKAVAVCNKGKIRGNNEDNLLFQYQYLEEMHDGIAGVWEHAPASTDIPALYGVFDGMGGHSKGEYASYVAAAVANQMVLIHPVDDTNITGLMDQICMESNDIICKKVKNENLLIGSTVAMVCFHENKCVCCNLGDSPVFRLRNGELDELYEEHTERKVREMIFGKEAVKGKKFSLTQHLGISLEDMQIVPYICEEDVQKGDIYLLCSDGLTDMVEMEEVHHILKGNIELK